VRNVSVSNFRARAATTRKSLILSHAPGTARTCNLQFRRLSLYPVELRVLFTEPLTIGHDVILARRKATGVRRVRSSEFGVWGLGFGVWSSAFRVRWALRMASHGAHHHLMPNRNPFRTLCSLRLCGESSSPFTGAVRRRVQRGDPALTGDAGRPRRSLAPESLAVKYGERATKDLPY
jgi:hypothetical protein